MIKQGDIFLLDEREELRKSTKLANWMIENLGLFTCRSLSFDNIEAFVDIYHKDVNNWSTLEYGVKNIIFTRMPFGDIIKYGNKIGFDEVSIGLEKKLFLSLPHRISRIIDVNWEDNIFCEQNALFSYLESTMSIEWLERKIELPEIYLGAQTKTGGWKKDELIKADNGIYFTSSEVLWKASLLQKVNIKNSIGVGIYRSGVKRGIPSYYIGGYYDRAGFLKSYEKDGNNIIDL